MSSAYHLSNEFVTLINERCNSAFAEVLSATSDTESPRGPTIVPSKEQIETLIDVSFWASLEKEEGRHHAFSLAFFQKENDSDHYIFKKPLGFNPEGLAKLAPALAGGEAHNWSLA
jgi:hypothetical protein